MENIFNRNAAALLCCQMPTPLYEALKAYFHAKTMLNTMSVINSQAQKSALNAINAVYRYPVIDGVEIRDIPEIVESKLGDVIDVWDDLYYTSDEEADAVYQHHNTTLKKLGFVSGINQCPFAVMRYNFMLRRNALIDEAAKYSGVSSIDVFNKSEFVNKLCQELVGFSMKLTSNE